LFFGLSSYWGAAGAAELLARKDLSAAVRTGKSYASPAVLTKTHPFTNIYLALRALHKRASRQPNLPSIVAS
jgi:hypothetical protein